MEKGRFTCVDGTIYYRLRDRTMTVNHDDFRYLESAPGVTWEQIIIKREPDLKDNTWPGSLKPVKQEVILEALNR